MNELNVLKRICRHLFLAVLLCAVSAATASAQVPTVTVDAKNVTIKELLQRIEANSQYTFAYIDADINPPRLAVRTIFSPLTSIFTLGSTSAMIEAMLRLTAFTDTRLSGLMSASM